MDSTDGYLLNERNASFKIHAEVDKLPDDSFLLVLLLLEYEHVMVEELLQTLVGVVDTQLFERVILTSNNSACIFRMSYETMNLSSYPW